MSAHAHITTRRPRARAPRAGRRPIALGGAEARLPWWALTLPLIAFVCLLALIMDKGPAEAAGDPALGRLLEHIRQTFTG
ncbi:MULTISPECIES: hypothetical protein [Streptomyces]|uniref:Uncharacterized protein n=1 Tax=Streptomyces chengmaiensis TaxID=3040919 RepID=A0ABT6HNW9_9ACTN|nr:MULTISPECIES: hypothetical protein [Streptomyces]MDH2390412.1 hypothetical protein [Streptomyces chengmaiensis]WRQ78754.1 hypothetical protein I3F59_004835 [Streptomyces sp. MUM 178J]